jgi:hypothetical protein
MVIGNGPRAYALAAANGCKPTVRRSSARAGRGMQTQVALPPAGTPGSARLAPFAPLCVANPTATVLTPLRVCASVATRLAAAPDNGFRICRKNGPSGKPEMIRDPASLLASDAVTRESVGCCTGGRMARGPADRYASRCYRTCEAGRSALLLFASHNDGYLTLGRDQPGCPSFGHSPG